MIPALPLQASDAMQPARKADGLPLPIIIIGFGGHGRVVLAALRAMAADVLAATDLDPQRQFAEGKLRLITDEQLIEQFEPTKIRLVSGIGSIKPCSSRSIRAQSIEKFRSLGYVFTGVRHPYAWVDPHTDVAKTSQIHAGSVIQPGCVIGDFTIVNTKASIDHDCIIGSMCHIGPGATLSGNVVVGPGAHLGTGCNVIQGVSIGENSFVAAGATVVENVPDGVYVRGTPAKPFQTASPQSRFLAG